jgi:hypothetical protein
LDILAQHTNRMANLKPEPFGFTSSIYFYLADSLIEDVIEVTKRELGEGWEDWYINDDSCPCDTLHKIDALIKQHLEKRFPEKVIREYDDALDDEIGSLFND